MQLPAAKAGSKTAALSGNGESKAEEKDSERCIKGIPVRTFIDEIKRQDRARREADGSLEEFPIVIPGIGLHAIKQKHAAKEQKALGGKAKNPKFEYQRAIMEHFLRDERRLVEREKQIFEQMEDIMRRFGANVRYNEKMMKWHVFDVELRAYVPMSTRNDPGVCEGDMAFGSWRESKPKRPRK